MFVGLLLLQVIVVLLFGIETKQMPLEALSEAMIARARTDASGPSVGMETRVVSSKRISLADFTLDMDIKWSRDESELMYYGSSLVLASRADGYRGSDRHRSLS